MTLQSQAHGMRSVANRIGLMRCLTPEQCAVGRVMDAPPPSYRHRDNLHLRHPLLLRDLHDPVVDLCSQNTLKV